MNDMACEVYLNTAVKRLKKKLLSEYFLISICKLYNGEIIKLNRETGYLSAITWHGLPPTLPLCKKEVTKNHLLQKSTFQF